MVDNSIQKNVLGRTHISMIWYSFWTVIYPEPIRSPHEYLTSPKYRGAITVEFTRMSHRRMAAIALAIRMFELDHGHRPEALQTLMTDYLEAIPRDPFSEGDIPVKYLPNADPQVLYCVGPDGVDDGGLFGWRDSEVEDSKRLDLVFFLNGDRPRRNP